MTHLTKSEASSLGLETSQLGPLIGCHMLSNQAVG